MTGGPHELALSVDLDEWFHSRRWVNRGRVAPHSSMRFHAEGAADNRPHGSLIAPTLQLLDVFDRHRCRCTFFVLGEVAGRYPDLVTHIASRGHEVACHAFHHVDMTALGPERFERHIASTAAALAHLTGHRPIGFRAPNLVYEPWATSILERHGFLYDSTVCRSRSICGKYQRWANAPAHPYRPSYEAIERRGTARLIEVPLASFPGLRLPAGSAIVTRIVGYWWTMLALRWRLRTGSTAFYLHPWEICARPPRSGPWLRDAIFVRRTGPWMLRVVERLLCGFEGRVVTAGHLMERFADDEWKADASRDVRTYAATGR
jgi:peptidoglycan/xylan/chitin deacetylase (PgdA/CDA1 family)